MERLLFTLDACTVSAHNIQHVHKGVHKREKSGISFVHLHFLLRGDGQLTFFQVYSHNISVLGAGDEVARRRDGLFNYAAEDT